MSDTKEIKYPSGKIRIIMQSVGINTDTIDYLIEHGVDDIELEDFIEKPGAMYIDYKKYLTRTDIDSIGREALRLKEESNKAKAGGGKRRKRRSRAKRTNKKRKSKKNKSKRRRR